MRQEKYHDSNPVVEFVIQRFFRRLRGVLEELRPESMLDAGCGEGEMLRRGAVPANLRPVLLDLRPDTPAHVLGSVQALPFAAGSFDVATCLEVLEHLEDPGATVRELARVARRAVVVSVPYEPWFRMGNVLRGKYLRHLGNYPEHVQHFNFGSLERLLAGCVPEVKTVEAFPWIIACCATKQR